eukprot:snap_masked-scaffold_28-processed-gene-0.3-mRNA-1 protein AED:0.32 eAED:0.35 QI:0/-1/0/1/-1/1/1/0/650
MFFNIKKRKAPQKEIPPISSNRPPRTPSTNDSKVLDVRSETIKHNNPSTILIQKRKTTEPVAIEVKTKKIKKTETEETSNDTKTPPKIQPKFFDKKKEESKDLINPSETFESLNLNSKLVRHLSKRFEINTPTQVQLKSIPPILSQRDILLKSKTGSGKTLAFLLPIIDLLLTPKFHKLSEDKISNLINRKSGIFCLIFSPTRELCQQIHEVLNNLLLGFNFLVSVLLSGGENRKSEKERLRRGANFIISTPKRFLDHFQNTISLRKQIKVETLRFIVLDEADRLCDKSFGVQISEVLTEIEKYFKTFIYKGNENSEEEIFYKKKEEEIGILKLDEVAIERDREIFKNCQMIFVSATLNETINLLIQSYLRNPIKIEISSVEKKFVLPEGLEQYSLITETKYRLVHLIFFLNFIQKEKQKILLFVSTRVEVEFLLSFLTGFLDKSFSSFKLHGSIAQKERKETYFKFNSDKFEHNVSRILICTDVAARGLDFKKVDYVVNYRAASEVSDYVHRVGRTARNKSKGRSVLFLNTHEAEFTKFIQGKNIFLKNLYPIIYKNNEITYSAVKSDKEQMKKQVFKRIEKEFKTIEEFVSKKVDLNKLAKDAARAGMNSYGTYEKKLKPIFHAKRMNLSSWYQSFGLKEKKKARNNF